MKRLFYILSFIFVFSVSFIIFNKVSFAFTVPIHDNSTGFANPNEYYLYDVNFSNPTNYNLKAAVYFTQRVDQTYGYTYYTMGVHVTVDDGNSLPEYFFQNGITYSGTGQFWQDGILYGQGNVSNTHTTFYHYYPNYPNEVPEYTYYNIGTLWCNVTAENLAWAKSLCTGIPVFDSSVDALNYLCGGGSSDGDEYPDFTNYEHTSLISCSLYAFPSLLDYGIGGFDTAFCYYDATIWGDADSAILCFFGQDGTLYKSLVLNDISITDYLVQESKGNVNITDVVKPNSELYVVCVPYDSVNHLYGDSCVLNFSLGESIFGALIRSFGGSDNNYYSSTLNVNDVDVPILSINSYTQSNIPYNPSNYNYSFLNNREIYNDYTEYYYPVFDNYTNLTDNDYEYINNNYNNTDIKIIEENTKTEFNFNININDLSSNDIQKVVDDTQDLFGLVGNLFPLIASMFALVFPFLMFDIPGAILVIGGILAGGALVGLGIKFINFIRGGNS